MLTDVQIDRYSRQIILPEVGGRGQERLLSATVALVDAGGEAALTLLYLAAAGVGRVTIRSVVRAKSWDRLVSDARDLNDDCDIEISELGADRLAAKDADLVVLAESSPGHGQEINAGCLRESKPLIWSRARGGSGYLAVFAPAAGTACYDCVTTDLTLPGETVDGVGCSAQAVLASVQATEAIKHILGMPSALCGSILRVDAVATQVTVLPSAGRAGCLTCSMSSLS